MSAKIVLLCCQAFFIQAISGQCLPYNAWISPCAAERWAEQSAVANLENIALAESRYGYGYPSGLGAASVAASNGGGLTVFSSSPIAPNGVSLFSENAIEGALAVAGELPFLGTVALEGALPTAGAGSVAYGSGNGNVGIMNEYGADITLSSLLVTP
ncbi:chorion class B protein M2410-like [Leptidea sinapis]|uniref:chorion class B protein M2410-like n=1 Tax=Leptidea sinapis TaxID=189913 RepID=UPI0021C3D381|nr:chorion class B protein M2410-like [Leptidea sinapis]